MKETEIPRPSDAVLTRLGAIAVRVEELMAFDQPRTNAPVGLTTIKNDRRRSVEEVLVLLADPELKNYLAKVRGLVA